MADKIMWFSNAPWEPSGYGQQTALTVPRLRDRLGYDVAITAFHGLQGAILPWAKNGTEEPIHVYPNWHHPWGSDIMTPHARHFGARIVISLFDIWVADLSMIGQSIHQVAWCPYFPVDSEPLPPRIKKPADFATERIVFSRFGERVVKDAGLDCYYIPHGIDSKEFYPTDQSEARRALGIPEDSFTFAIVAANKGNPSRKCLTEQLLAFKSFKETVDGDAILIMHTTTGEAGEFGGEKLISFANNIGLAVNRDIFFSPPYYMTIGFSPNHLNRIMNAADVLLNVSRGEGFGLTPLEAQMAGTPVITGQWTAMEELCFSGWMVPKALAVPTWNPLESWHYTPPPSRILEQMKAAYEELSPRYPGSSKRAKQYSTKARKGALQYEINNIVDEYWRPVLKEIFSKIDAEDEGFDEAISMLKPKQEEGKIL